MPINFTVVPVEDAEGDSNSAAEAGGNKPVSLGELFGEKKDENNLQESNKGRDTVKDQASSLACRHAHTLREVSVQCLLISVRGGEEAESYPSMH